MTLLLTNKVPNMGKLCTMSKILGRLTKAQRRITIFVSVTGQKLYTVGVGTVHYLPQWLN